MQLQIVQFQTFPVRLLSRASVDSQLNSSAGCFEALAVASFLNLRKIQYVIVAIRLRGIDTSFWPVNLDLRSPASLQEARISNNPWSENARAGQFQGVYRDVGISRQRALGTTAVLGEIANRRTQQPDLSALRR